VKRRQVGTRGVQAPETAAELVKWLREMAKEDTQFIVLQPASTAGAEAAR